MPALLCPFLLVAILWNRLIQDRHIGALNMHSLNWIELNWMWLNHVIALLLSSSSSFSILHFQDFLLSPTYSTIRKPLSSPCFTVLVLEFTWGRRSGCPMPLRTPGHRVYAPEWSCQAFGTFLALDCNNLGGRDEAVFVMRVRGMTLQSLLVQRQRSIYLVNEG